MLNDSLCENVQHNCNIADAKHAANYTLCIYLMKMREYYRWEKGYSYNEMLPKDEVGEWVAEREDLWEQLEQEKFLPLEIDGKLFDPFDTDSINASLLHKGMVYSGGLGARSVPHFFLGKLDTTKQHENYQVIVSAEECARDLSAPPAMTLGNTIFIRKESIRRMLWEKVQEWQWHKLDNAMAKAVACYNFEHNINTAINQMTEIELNSIVLHEIGEIQSARQLGSKWKEILTEYSSSRLEIMLRAIKDLLADSISTLPALIEDRNVASIHFYAANMTAMRKDLCPSFMEHYQKWSVDQNFAVLQQWLTKSVPHWQNTIEQVIAMHNEEQSLPEIEQYIEANRL